MKIYNYLLTLFLFTPLDDEFLINFLNFHSLIEFATAFIIWTSSNASSNSKSNVLNAALCKLRRPCDNCTSSIVNESFKFSLPSCKLVIICSLPSIPITLFPIKNTLIDIR